MVRVDFFRYIHLIPIPQVRYRALDRILNWAIPFNRQLGLRIMDLSSRRVTVLSRPTKKRTNHVGGAHACFLALLGEYPAGLLVGQMYPFDRHRLIISRLEIDYHKQGRGPLTATALAPDQWPPFENGVVWVDMVTEIINAQSEPVATCRTRWQVKEWSQVGQR